RPAHPPWEVVNGFSAHYVPAGELIPIDADGYQRLSGIVDVRARIEDPQSFHGMADGLPAFMNDLHPAHVHLVITQKATGKVVADHDVFQTNYSIGKQASLLGLRVIDISDHFAPGTREAFRGPQAYHSQTPAGNELWFRLFEAKNNPATPYWDTHQ